MNLLKFVFLVVVFWNCQTNDSMDMVRNFGAVTRTNQKITISKITNLNAVINETSGLINFNGRLITHNDSGGEPALYEIDITNGNIIRTVTISNAKNKDIEDIAQDDDFIYLCDIGNNSNKRKDQTIYKINKSDYLTNDEVVAEKITFSYKEQTNFTRSNQKTNFDAEAVVNINENLFLFTKNWGDLKTSVYRIPKEKGNYKLTRIDSYNINGLITGADYNTITKSVILTGYLNFIPFIVRLSDFSQNNPLDGKIEKKTLDVNGSIQIEGIASNPDGTYYISAEEFRGIPAVLYKLTLDDLE
jgi:hypothetical protein